MSSLRVEKMRSEDCEFLNTLRNSCVDFLHDSRTFTLEQTREWFNKLTIPYYIIWDDTKRVGYIRLSNLENESIYIGCDIVPDERQKGVAYKSLSLLIPKLFEEYSLKSIIAEVLEYNTASLNLYRKLGFSVNFVKKNCVEKKYGFSDSIVLVLNK